MFSLLPLLVSAVSLLCAKSDDPTCNRTCNTDMQCALAQSNCTWCIAGHCTTEPATCRGGVPPPAKTNSPQYFIVGDSVSHGYSIVGDLVGTMHQKGFEAFPMNGGGGGEAGNTKRGLSCLPSWLGHNRSRFNVVSWNFGLHDLSKSSWDGPNTVLVEAYERNLVNISHLLSWRLPIAKQLFITTTPVPTSSVLSPPRNESDVLVYNLAAKRAMAKVGVPVLDLWAWVDDACGGDPYTECPAGCAKLPGGDAKNCLQREGNVHFWKQGYLYAVKAIAAAVEVVHSGKACPDFLKQISAGLCGTDGGVLV